MIKSLAHVCIGATSLQASEEFYCRKLGLEKRFAYYRAGREFGFYLALPNGAFIEVFHQEDADPSYDSPIRHFCLEVDDIDAFAEAMRAKGLNVTEKKRGRDQSWQVWLKDPTGIAVEIHQYTEASRQVTGEDYVQPDD